MSDSRLFFGRLGWYGAAGAVDRLVSLALLPLFVAYLAPAEYGLVALALAVASVLLNLGDGGLSLGFMRDWDDERLGDRATKFSTYFWSVLGITLALCVVAWPLATALPPFLRLLTLLYVVANFIGFTVLVRFRIDGQPQRYFIATAATSALKLLGIWYLLNRLDACVTTDGVTHADFVLLGFAGANLLVAVGLLIGSASLIRVRFDGKLVAGYFRFGFPLALTALCFCGLEVLDRFLIQFFTGSTDAVGVYDMNYKVAGLMLLVITPVLQLWPEYLYKKESRVREETYQVYLLVLSYAWLLLMLAALYWMCSRDYFSWFGFFITPLVALGYFCFGLYPFYSAEFQQEKRTQPILLAALLALAVNVGANCWLIPELTSERPIPAEAGHGAAAATVLGYATLICCLWFLRWRAGIARIDHWRVWRGTIPWFIALVAAVALPWTLAVHGLWFVGLVVGGEYPTPAWWNWTTLLAIPVLMGAYLVRRIYRVSRDVSTAVRQDLVDGQPAAVSPGDWRQCLRAQADYQQTVCETPLRRVLFRLAADLLALRLAPGMAVLDLGSGRGRVTATLPGNRISIDPIVPELKAAGSGRRAAGIGEALPLRSASVDAAVLNSVIHCVRDFPAVARELHRVLKPGGMVVIQEAPHQPVSASHLRTVTVAGLKRELAAAGLTVRRVRYRGVPWFNPALVALDNRLGCGICSLLLGPFFVAGWVLPILVPVGGWLAFVEAERADG